MIKQIFDKNLYELNPSLSVSTSQNVEVKLFGKSYYMYDNDWMHHVHIKINDKCNAKCAFCIEKGSNIKQNKEKLIGNLTSLLDQMSKQGMLKTISITGGEPTLCDYLQEVLTLIDSYEGVFTTINTNGRLLISKQYENLPQWIDISKHAIDDSSIFGLFNLNKESLNAIKAKTERKIRLQSVIHNNGLKDVKDVLSFIEEYKDVADDFSFRQLINDGSNFKDEPTLYNLRKFLYENAELDNQTFQDYYVYETWNYNGVVITLSFSDMKMLKESEKEEQQNMLREIIVFPDGLISGSWDRENKIIK